MAKENKAVLVSEGLQVVAGMVDRQIEKLAGERCGFILFVWAGGEVSYVGTDPDRTAAIKAMRELITKWEGGVVDTPAHQRN